MRSSTNSPQVDPDAYVPGHCMHGRIVARSPLGEPSEAAKRFLEQPDRYEAYVEPSPSIAKAGALADAQRVAREFRPDNDQTPGRAMCRRAGDASPNDLRLVAQLVDEAAVRIRAVRCVDEAEVVEQAANSIREQAKAIELLALDISEGLGEAA